MIKKLLFTLSLCMLMGSALFAQSTIKGVVKDTEGNPLSYLNVQLKKEGSVVNGAMTDDKGEYQIHGIAAGTYDFTTVGSFNCLTTHTEKGIYVANSETKFLNLTINCSSTELIEVEVIYVPPIFTQDNTVSSNKLSGDDVRKAPGRSITGVLANLEGVATQDGKITSVRGARSDGQRTIIDGVTVRGLGGVSFQSIEGVELIQGGIPAEYGDGTSFTVITTRGVSKDFHGGVGLQSSLEGYGQMLAEAFVSGPLLKGKTSKDPARVGFLISAEGTYDIDNRPLRGGTWVAKPEVIKSITEKPIDYRFIQGRYATFVMANELESDAFKKIRVRQNAEDWGFITQAKIDVMGGGKDANGRSKNNLRFSLGGSYQYSQWRGWGSTNNKYWNYSGLFNSKNNGIDIRNTFRIFARINHRVKTDTTANAILKNVMYDINVNYTLTNGKHYDKNHKDNLFAYGYIGKFTTDRSNHYAPPEIMRVMKVTDKPSGEKDTAYYDAEVIKLENYLAEDWMTFEKSGFTKGNGFYNPDLLPYTQNFIDWILEKTGVDVNNATLSERMIVNQFLGLTCTKEAYQQYWALLNGTENLSYVGNDLYLPPGYVTSGYWKLKQEAIGAKASLSMNLQDHEIKFGFEFEKLTNRSYSVAASGLWNYMRRLTVDKSIFPFDFENPYWKSGRAWEDPNIIETPYYTFVDDTLMYHVIPNLNNFDKNLRTRMGITNDKVFLDIDSYDPNIFSLDLFSNYELLNSGNNYVDYSGYDYLGNISNKKFNPENFFSGGPTKKHPDNLDLHDKNKYVIGAFEPIYLAFYLQDKFSIQNLLFNVGLRLDYFNANQYVLKDPFLLRDAHTVQDLKNVEVEGWDPTLFPDNCQPNWIPYVSVAENDLSSAPHAIVAFRSGNTWYNSYGQEVTDPTNFLGAGGPVLKEVKDVGDPSYASADAFRKYRPQLSLMPRISFSFPVSTNSLFYAHYDIYTYRPQNLQIDPVAYLFIPSYQSDSKIISNPNLRLQKTVDYEIGFRQKVGEYAALNVSAYYREVRDEIQAYRFTGAYPNTYYSYENQDFGTVQGYILGLTMRGTKNLSFNVSYTLSFAKGTGSDPKSNLTLIASGQPNLRTLANLSHDQRHKVGANIYFRFDSGKDYNGPKTIMQKKGTDTKKEIRWFENAGASLLITAGSGMPYSRSGAVYSYLGWGGEKSAKLKGSINGANMPWGFQCNLRLEKSFMLNLASKKEKTDSGKPKNKPGFITVHVDFQNLLNIKNVINVYDYTGSPKDDGYLSSQLFQSQAASFSMPISAARNYYEMTIANPYNYNQPFRVYMGLNFSF